MDIFFDLLFIYNVTKAYPIAQIVNLNNGFQTIEDLCKWQLKLTIFCVTVIDIRIIKTRMIYLILDKKFNSYR